MKIDIKHVAKLANLNITHDEEIRFEKQLSEILDYFKNLNEADTENVMPTTQSTGLVNAEREDSDVMLSLTQKEALKNARSQYNGLFKVKAILEEI